MAEHLAINRASEDPTASECRVITGKTEEECAMSTDYRLLRKVPACDLFDGRLEESGVRERVKPEETTEKSRLLTEVAITCGLTLTMTALSAASQDTLPMVTLEKF